MFKEIETFDWMDLAGKTLEMVVVSDGKLTIINGRDVKTGKIYVIASKEEN
jgi:hypothetical protein